jgi:hypothetical protein
MSAGGGMLTNSATTNLDFAMQCPLFQSLLFKAVESHSDSVSPEVRTHATTCVNPACIEAWAEHALQALVIPQWKSELPLVDLTERVMAELSPSQPVAALPPAAKSVPALRAFFEQSWHDFRSPQQRSWSLALSVVGVMLLIGTLIVLVPQSPNAEIAVRPRYNPSVAQSGEQWASRTSNPPHQVNAQNVAIQSVEWAQKASTLMATAIVSIPEKSADWVPDNHWDASWQLKLEPIRRDAHAAWDTLLDQLPMQNPPSS